MRLAMLVLVLATGCSGSPFTTLTAAGDAGGAAKDGAAQGYGGAAVPDGGIVASGGSPSDAGPGGTTESVPCGYATCAIPGESCCVSANSNPPPDFSYACVNGPTCPAAGGDSGASHTAALQCTGAANCPSGTVCCMYEQQMPRQVVSQCLASCMGSGRAQLCDPNAPPDQSGCPLGVTCSSMNIGDWDLPSTFATCGGVGN